MNLRIPVYVEDRPGCTVRPLFVPDLVEAAPLLSRAVSRLTGALRRRLDEAADRPRHRLLARLAWSPVVDGQMVRLTLDLKKTHPTLRLMVAWIEAFGRRLAFFPTVPDLWFELERGEDLARRATEVLEAHLRAGGPEPLSLHVEGRAWLATVDLQLQTPTLARPVRKPSALAALMGLETMDGARELRKVAHRLDEDRAELARAVGREREVEAVQGLSGSGPVLLVGPPRVGKTAVVHEVVRRSRKTAFWHLSPQRLISGMSYVGQWEARLVAILKHARKAKHVLVLDDLVGLFLAGVSADADLSVADVLKPYLARREVQVIAEITGEALGVLRERDRGFADLFQVVPIRAMDEAGTLRVGLAALREAEARHRCTFEPEALTAALDLQRRYAREEAFPGKLARFLGQLAARYRATVISREQVLDLFHARSGLSLRMLDDRRKLDRREIHAALAARIVGQEEAVEAMVDAVGLARARVQDPTRPLASLLFVGPTGVGKTECAKALAAFLFGDPERLLRFDMNEYVEAGSAARLVGTFRQPEGRLTAAVRRRPFAVLLLDEIEKAHPEVLTLLLQVMGDARLTDSLGRTVDFSGTILLMTSNLGVREASRPLGLRAPGEEGDELVYRRAAEAFFPPELFNRIDRVVPFRRLSLPEIRRIARLQLDRVLSREGLVRRQCILQVDDEALEVIAARGYDPHLGARALKRALERDLAAPVAAQLAGMPPNTPSVVRLHAGGVSVVALRPVEPRGWPVPEDVAGLAARIERAVEAVEAGLQGAAGPVAAEELDLHYFGVRDQARRVRALARRLSGVATLKPGAPRRGDPRRETRPLLPGSRDLLATADVRTAVRDLGASLQEPPRPLPVHVAAEALRELALLQALARARSARLEVTVRPAGAEADWLRGVLRLVAEALDLELEGPALSGPLADLLELEAGVHLFLRPDGSLFPVDVQVGDLRREGQVVRLYEWDGDGPGVVADLGTGLAFRGSGDFRSLLLAALPLELPS